MSFERRRESTEVYYPRSLLYIYIYIVPRTVIVLTSIPSRGARFPHSQYSTALNAKGYAPLLANNRTIRYGPAPCTGTTTAHANVPISTNCTHNWKSLSHDRTYSPSILFETIEKFERKLINSIFPQLCRSL